jgi:hypothetical protein
LYQIHRVQVAFLQVQEYVLPVSRGFETQLFADLKIFRTTSNQSTTWGTTPGPGPI